MSSIEFKPSAPFSVENASPKKPSTDSANSKLVMEKLSKLIRDTEAKINAAKQAQNEWSQSIVSFEKQSADYKKEIALVSEKITTIAARLSLLPNELKNAKEEQNRIQIKGVKILQGGRDNILLDTTDFDKFSQELKTAIAKTQQLYQETEQKNKEIAKLKTTNTDLEGKLNKIDLQLLDFRIKMETSEDELATLSIQLDAFSSKAQILKSSEDQILKKEEETKVASSKKRKNSNGKQQQGPVQKKQRTAENSNSSSSTTSLPNPNNLILVGPNIQMISSEGFPGNLFHLVTFMQSDDSNTFFKTFEKILNDKFKTPSEQVKFLNETTRQKFNIPQCIALYCPSVTFFMKFLKKYAIDLDMKSEKNKWSLLQIMASNNNFNKSSKESLQSLVKLLAYGNLDEINPQLAQKKLKNSLTVQPTPYEIAKSMCLDSLAEVFQELGKQVENPL